MAITFEAVCRMFHGIPSPYVQELIKLLAHLICFSKVSVMISDATCSNMQCKCTELFDQSVIDILLPYSNLSIIHNSRWPNFRGLSQIGQISYNNQIVMEQIRKDKGEKESQEKKQQPKNTAPPTLKRYFSNNTVAMIILNSNYVYSMTKLFVNSQQKFEVEGTSTFYFYERFFKYGNYQQLPDLPGYFNFAGGELMKSLLLSLMVTMPKFVFDQFLFLIRSILAKLDNQETEEKITQEILMKSEEYPHLTFQAEAIGKLGYEISESNVDKVRKYLNRWISSLVALVSYEIREEDNMDVFEREYERAKKNESVVEWSNTKENQKPLFVKKFANVGSTEEDQSEDEEEKMANYEM